VSTIEITVTLVERIYSQDCLEGDYPCSSSLDYKFIYLLALQHTYMQQNKYNIITDSSSMVLVSAEHQLASSASGQK